MEQITARLDDRFRLLTGGLRTALPRQQTLRAAIDWSYNLLTEGEKKLLRDLTVFSGSWTLEAAESVCSEEESESDILNLLTQLVEKSLVNLKDSHYHILETTRQYASEKLLDSGTGTSIHEKHLNYFLDLAKQADKEIHGSSQVEWLDILETEHDNYRVSLDWCISNDHIESALYLIGSFSGPGRFWSVRSYYSEACNWFDKIRISPNVTLYPLAYATALNGMSFIAGLQGDFVAAFSMAEESQRICQSLGAEGELELAGALFSIGVNELWSNGHNLRVKNCYEQAAAIYQVRGDRWERALALLRLGITAHYQDDYERSQLLFEESLVIFKDCNDAFGLGRVYQEMCRLYQDQGDYDHAHKVAKQALAYNRQIRFRSAMCSCLNNLGEICRVEGDYDQAEIYLNEELSIAREFNLEEGNLSHFYLGCVNLYRREYTIAKTRLIEFIKINHKLGIQYLVGEGLIGLAAVAAGIHQYDRAARLAGAGQAVHDAVGYVMDPHDRIEINPLLQVAREQLGDVKFEELTLKACSMTMEQAIAYAFEE